jgi:flagellar basal-body rod protein FlgF
MDRLIYIAMTGAQQALAQQSVTAHNLANAGTTGYKAETTAFRVAPVTGPGLPTRAYAVETTTGADFTPAAIQKTGRDLDVAIDGDGFIVVQGRDGSEAYTRNGSLALDTDGQLQTRTGLLVMGDGGPITIPPDSKLAIGKDGTISATTGGQSAANVAVLGKLKLVNPATTDLARGAAGLYRMKNGGEADVDPAVTLAAGALEDSNVNSVGAMIDMISIARQFDMQMKLLQNAEQNAQRATTLLGAGP